MNRTKKRMTARLVSTTDTGFTGVRQWTESPASLKKSGDTWRSTAPLPAGITAWFINVRSGKLTASSDFQNSRQQP